MNGVFLHTNIISTGLAEMKYWEYIPKRQEDKLEYPTQVTNMHDVIAKLLLIQNLDLAVHESGVIHRRREDMQIKERLEKNLSELKAQLRPDIIATYERLHKRYQIAVSPMMNQTCTGCFMKLPVAEANRVKGSKDYINCPSCNRFLYFEEMPEKVVEYNDLKGIARFSSPDMMYPNVTGKNKEDVLKKISANMSSGGFVTDKKEFTQALLDREKLFSTAMGHGIAFPHARGLFAKGLTFALALSKEGIDFGCGETVHLMAIFAVPTQVNMFYLEIVSKLAKYFEKPDKLKALLTCETSEEMWKILTRLGR